MWNRISIFIQQTVSLMQKKNFAKNEFSKMDFIDIQQNNAIYKN